MSFSHLLPGRLLPQYVLLATITTAQYLQCAAAGFLLMLFFLCLLHRRGNLLTRTLADIVHKEDFVLNSEYLITLLVVVPK